MNKKRKIMLLKLQGYNFNIRTKWLDDELRFRTTLKTTFITRNAERYLTKTGMYWYLQFLNNDERSDFSDEEFIEDIVLIMISEGFPIYTKEPSILECILKPLMLEDVLANWEQYGCYAVIDFS